MSPTIYSLAMESFVPMLHTLSGLLDKGAAHAAAKGFKPGVLVNARLAPDMLPLSAQVQIASDQAVRGASRLAGREPPSFPDVEQTIEELKTRIASAIGYLQSLSESEFAGAAERRIVLPLREGRVLDMDGQRFLRDWVLPQFYFHVTTAYDILRHNGVDIGKRDYLVHVAPFIRMEGKK
jgi:uncharacterized protein